MNYNMKDWKHVFKVDPQKEISDEHLNKLCESGTDAIIVGGTDGVTFDNVLDYLSRIRRFTVPCILEISEIDAVVPGYDYYFIPMVLNSTEKKWIMDIQHEAIKTYKSLINWDEMKVEGYCILNPDAKAYKKTNAVMPTKKDILSYAFMAEHMFNLPFFYIEYSGMYGDVNLLSEIKKELKNTLLMYGGGIKTPSQAKEMKEHADIIIVGNSIYTDFEAALSTVDAVK